MTCARRFARRSGVRCCARRRPPAPQLVVWRGAWSASVGAPAPRRSSCRSRPGRSGGGSPCGWKPASGAPSSPSSARRLRPASITSSATRSTLETRAPVARGASWATASRPRRAPHRPGPARRCTSPRRACPRAPGCERPGRCPTGRREVVVAARVDRAERVRRDVVRLHGDAVREATRPARRGRSPALASSSSTWRPFTRAQTCGRPTGPRRGRRRRRSAGRSRSRPLRARGCGRRRWRTSTSPGPPCRRPPHRRRGARARSVT